MYPVALPNPEFACVNVAVYDDFMMSALNEFVVGGSEPVNAGTPFSNDASHSRGGCAGTDRREGGRRGG